MNTYRSRLLPSLAAAAVLALAACHDAPSVSKPVDPTANLPRGIHPVLIASETGPTTEYVTLELRRVQVAEKLGAVQGELRYDPAALELTGAEVSNELEGDFYPAAPGRVIFAGLSLDGAQQAPVITLHFIRHGAVQEAGFSLRMDEVTSADDYASLLPLVSTRAHPFLITR